MKPHHLMLAVLLLLLTFGLRLNLTANLGLQADEGVHNVAAMQVADGKVLYRDVFENRTPGFEWLLAGLFRLAGVHWFLGRVVSVLAATLMAAALIGINRLAVKGRYREWAGLLAAFLFALAPLAIFWSRFAMLESIETAVATLAIFCGVAALSRPQITLWLAAGVFTGIAILTKQSGLVLLPVFLVILLHVRDKKGLVAYLVGVGFLLALFLAVLWRQAALADFLHYFSGVDRLALWANLPAKGMAFWGWARQQPILPLAVLGGVVLLIRPSAQHQLILLWAVVEFGALLLPAEADFGWGGFSHYALSALAAGSLLAGAGLVYLWQSIHTKRGYILALFGCVLLIILSGPGWLVALNEAVWQTTYPQSDMTAEQQVGQAVSLVTGLSDSLVVLGNSGFYYWADRPPTGKFFHFPSYLADSPLLPEVEQDIQHALQDSSTGAVLISRQYLDERLTPPMLDSLQQSWVPAFRFEYPYQKGVFLFLRPSSPDLSQPPAAQFVDSVRLLTIGARRLDATNILIQVSWQTDEALPNNEVAFVHLLRPDGSLAAQHDSISQAGFRPTSSWAPGEIISDWHWLTTQKGEITDAYTLSIGLYDPISGARRLLQNEDSGVADSFVIPLSEVLKE